MPSRLGPDARRFIGASWLVQLTDGIALVAGPLAVASLTGSPFLVAFAVALHRLPVLLLRPYAALLADLVNRRLLVVAADGLRGAIVIALAGLLALGLAPAALVLLALLALGVLETAADSAREPVLRMLVPDPDAHEIAGARLDAGFVLGTQLVGPAVGALLFTLGAAVPFLVEGLLLAGGAVVLSRVALAGPARGPAPAAERHPVRAGLRRIMVDPPLSGLVLTGLAAQVAWAAGWSLLVVYAGRQLGLGPVGFGVLMVVGAAGGLAGVLLQPVGAWLAGRTRTAYVILGGLALEAVGHAVLGHTTVPLVAGGVVAMLGTIGFVTGDLARAVRRERTSADGSGDAVTAAWTTLSLAATVIGCVLGGVLASVGGISAAYWGGAVVLFVALAVLGRRVAAL